MLAMYAGDHTMLNSGSTAGHDVFPFKTSISILICLSPLRPAHLLHTRDADGKLELPGPGSKIPGLRGITHDRRAALILPALVDFGRSGRPAQPRNGHAAKLWAVSALDPARHGDHYRRFFTGHSAAERGVGHFAACRRHARRPVWHAL